MAFKIILCAITAYLIGCINPSYIIGKIRGMDIRRKGSGNAGASNALILMGKSVAVFSALFDIMKAAGVMWLAPVIFKGVPAIAEIAGVSCTIGHIFPIFMRFQGGKGLACLGGILLAIDYRLLLVMLAIEIIIVLLVDYICVIPIMASIALPVLYAVLGDLNIGWLRRAGGGGVAIAVLCVITVVIVIKHIHNLRRILHGTELHFSYMWMKDRDAEIARIHENQARWDRQKEEKLARTARGK
jgi:glycerol-3-phosphate acyltransferase PlsY